MFLFMIFVIYDQTPFYVLFIYYLLEMLKVILHSCLGNTKLFYIPALETQSCFTFLVWKHKVVLHSCLGNTKLFYIPALETPSCFTSLLWKHKVVLRSCLGNTKLFYIPALETVQRKLQRSFTGELNSSC